MQPDQPSAAPFALVVGESLVDVVTDASGVRTERPGGSAANVAVALARLGRPVRFLTAYAADDRGAVLDAHLAASGVEPAADPHVLDHTSSAAATIGPDGAATYSFDLQWRLPVVPDLVPAFLHVCSLGAVLAPGADQVLALAQALAPTATVLYDVNARPAITGTGPDLVARVEALCRTSHLVKASDEDLAVLYPLLGVDEASAQLLTLGPQAVVVTEGPAGISWYDGSARVHVDAPPATVVDTIGAGDTVAAALLDALWDGLGPAEALAHAARAAAVTVSRPGADPPTRAELARRG